MSVFVEVLVVEGACEVVDGDSCMCKSESNIPVPVLLCLTCSGFA